jgi:DNA-binding CsgD family transcriptional regulator
VTLACSARVPGAWGFGAGPYGGAPPKRRGAVRPGIVALRRGDLNAARGYLDGLPAPGPFEAAYEADWRALVAAQLIEASSGPRAAADGLASLYAGLDQHRYLLMSDPASAVWLVRVALAAGDTGRAEAAAAVMAQIHYDNPGIPVYRPATGWDSLTDTERSTSELVAQGLTNQQVADQLFISVHTVAFHLRQVFRKLGIGSRVELARIALERSAGREPDTPGSSLIPGARAGPAQGHPCLQDTRPGRKASHRDLDGVGSHRGGRRVWSRGRRSRRGS